MNDQIKKLEELKKDIKNPDFIKIINKKIKRIEDKTVYKDGN